MTGHPPRWVQKERIISLIHRTSNKEILCLIWNFIYHSKLFVIKVMKRFFKKTKNYQIIITLPKITFHQLFTATHNVEFIQKNKLVTFKHMNRQLAHQLALSKHLYLTHFCLSSCALPFSRSGLITSMRLDGRKDIKICRVTPFQLNTDSMRQ